MLAEFLDSRRSQNGLDLEAGGVHECHGRGAMESVGQHLWHKFVLSNQVEFLGCEPADED